ncbi:MAG: MFS transporter [Actinomycetota bacterium]
MRTRAPRWFGIDLARHRWLFPLAGLLGSAIGGTTYALSVFVNPWEAEFGWGRAETLSSLAVIIFAHGAAVFLGGIAVDRWGPRPAMVAGGALVVFGMWNASRISTLSDLLIGFSLCFGLGIGLIYTATTIALVARWYPDQAKRGVAIGCSLVGFGMSAVVAAPLWTWGLESIGWRATFQWSAILVAVIAIGLASLVRFPPVGWTWTEANGWHHARPDAADRASVEQFSAGLTLAEALHNRHLWTLALLFLLCTSGGLLAIGQAAAWAENSKPSGLGVSAGTAAIVVGVLSLANGLGRPAFGLLSAHLGARRSMVLAYTSLAGGLAAMAVVPVVWLAIPAVFIIGLSFGGALSLNPVMAASLFGVRSVGRIYGFLFFIGFGFGGLVGPLLGGVLYDRLNDYAPVFVLAAAMSATAAVLARRLLPPPDTECQYTPPSLNASSVSPSRASLAGAAHASRASIRHNVR